MAKTPTLSGSQHAGANSVPVITLNHNTAGRSDEPKVAARRGKTNLPKDTAGYGMRVTGPGGKQKTC